MENFYLSNRSEFIGSTFKIIDMVVIAIASLLAHFFILDSLSIPGKYLLFIVLIMIATYHAFSWFSVYRAWRGQSIYREITYLSFGWTFVILAVSTLIFLTLPDNNYSRAWMVLTYASTYFVFIGYRIIIRIYLRKARSKGINQKRVIIVGAGTLGRRACTAMLNQHWAGFKPVAFFDDDLQIIGQKHNGIEVKGDINDVVTFIESQRNQQSKPNQIIDAVWIALPLSAYKRIEKLQNDLLDTATNVYFIPDLFGFNLTSYSIDEVVGLPIMNMSATTMDGPRGFIKRVEDILLSIILLLILSPVLLIIAALIKTGSTGPIFFKQRRYGQDGKEFLVWKFRSMKVTEDGDNVVQAKKEDDRITPIGKWLRKLSLDELPQLFNVLEGSMSMIGPRPHAVAHNEFYRKKVLGYMARHKIRPGITGWAQVNGSRGETAQISDMEERIQYDLEYIKNWSIFLDIRILFMTIRTVSNYKDTY